MSIRLVAACCFGFFALQASPLPAQQPVTRGNNLAVDVAADGRVAMDLRGDVWIVPAGGGDARRVTANVNSARRPRWSPDGLAIAYEAELEGTQGIWILNLETHHSHLASRADSFGMHPAWHPDGERLVYASDTNGTGLDLWEVDLPTGLHWRLSQRVGDESDAAWSADGHDLVYVHHHEDTWSIVLRRFGLPEETLLSSTDRLAGPSWRPDGSLITYARKNATGTTLEMVILSQPRVFRVYASDEEFGLAPVSWLDRHRMLYAAGGLIRQRLLNAWTSTVLPFQAIIEAQTQPASAQEIRRRPLPRIDEPAGRLVIHAARLFDGIGVNYRFDHDVVIDGGRITAVEPHTDRSGTIIIDMGDLAVLPGYVDSRASIAPVLGRFADRAGPLLLATGLTTVLAGGSDHEALNTRWSGKAMPGPRLLDRKDWPLNGPRAFADAMTPGLESLLASRQARLIGVSSHVGRRFSVPTDLQESASDAVLVSDGNGLPAGLALHAEFRALVAAGLKPQQALKAAGVNAAAALQLDPLLGRIAVGAAADLVFIDGDPLSNIEDALRVVAVVRNGRFFSVSGLVDRVATAESVE